MIKLFFIAGCGRSGTTMLQQALNRHSQIVIPTEIRFLAFLRFAKNSQRQQLRRIAWDLGIEMPSLSCRVGCTEEGKALYYQIASLYMQRLGRTQACYFGEKSGENLFYLKDIRRLFPEAKIIVIYRDGRDVALSLSKVPWMPSDLYSNFFVWLYYQRMQAVVMNARMSHVYAVKYEDLVANSEQEFGKILNFLGLPYEREVAEGHGNHEGVSPWQMGWKARALGKISESRVGIWKNELTPVEITTLERWGGRTLKALGYELSTNDQGPLPWSFFPGLFWRLSMWRARTIMRAIYYELWRDEWALVEDCKKNVA